MLNSTGHIVCSPILSPEVNTPLATQGESIYSGYSSRGLPSFLWTREANGVTGAEECRCVRKRVRGRSVRPTNLLKPTASALTYERCAECWRWLLAATTPGFRNQRALEDVRLLRLIRASFVASHSIYGAPRVFLDLRDNQLRTLQRRVCRWRAQKARQLVFGVDSAATVSGLTSLTAELVAG
jgi:hypothetical protein